METGRTNVETGRKNVETGRKNVEKGAPLQKSLKTWILVNDLETVIRHFRKPKQLNKYKEDSVNLLKFLV